MGVVDHVVLNAGGDLGSCPLDRGGDAMKKRDVAEITEREAVLFACSREPLKCRGCRLLRLAYELACADARLYRARAEEADRKRAKGGKR
jgi:hypothetical protein